MAQMDTMAPSSTVTFGSRFVMAGIGAAMGLCIGGMIWLTNKLTGQHHEVMVNTLVLTLVQGGIGFFASPRKAAWMDTILYFVLLGFLDS
jgi:hypothetical protein